MATENRQRRRFASREKYFLALRFLPVVNGREKPKNPGAFTPVCSAAESRSAVDHIGHGETVRESQVVDASLGSR